MLINILFLFVIFALLNFWSWKIPLTNDEAFYLLPEMSPKDNTSGIKFMFKSFFRVVPTVYHGLKNVFHDKLEYKWIRIATYILIFSTSILTYFLAKVLLSDEIAVISALFFIILSSYPPLLLFNFSGEQPETFFTVLGMFFCFMGLAHSTSAYIFLGGVFLSLALTAFIKAIPYIFCLPFTLVFYLVVYHISFAKFLLLLFYYLCGIAAVLFPFVMYCGLKDISAMLKFVRQMKKVNKINYKYYFGGKFYFSLTQRLFRINFLPVLPFIIYGIFICLTDIIEKPYYILLLLWFSFSLFVNLIQKIACWLHPYIMIPSVALLAVIGIQQMFLRPILFYVSSLYFTYFLFRFIRVGFFEKKKVYSYSRFSQYDVNKKCCDCGEIISKYLKDDDEIFVFGPFLQIYLFSKARCAYPPLLYMWFPENEDVFDTNWEKNLLKVFSETPPSIIVLWKDWLPLVDWNVFKNGLGLKYEKLFPDNFCDGFFAVFHLVKKQAHRPIIIPEKFTIRKDTN